MKGTGGMKGTRGSPQSLICLVPVQGSPMQRRETSESSEKCWSCGQCERHVLGMMLPRTGDPAGYNGFDSLSDAAAKKLLHTDMKPLLPSRWLVRACWAEARATKALGPNDFLRLIAAF